MRERDFVKQFKKDLEDRFPGCLILKQEPNITFQGIPDHIVLYEDKWAALEFKKDKKAKRQPNQPWHVARMNKMSYAAIVEPSNAEEVLDDLQSTFRPRRKARIS
jgi:hypothetical protein